MCAEAMKMILDDVPELELGDFIKKGYACCYSYFSDILEQQQCMHWIINDYLGLSGVHSYRPESGGATPIDAIVNAALRVRSGMFPAVPAVSSEKMNELPIQKVNEAKSICQQKRTRSLHAKLSCSSTQELGLFFKNGDNNLVI